jgi:predicted nucleotidyltransferase
VLIGAAALGCHMAMTWRRTDDIDLSVVADVSTTASELRVLGFRRHPKLEHRWFSPREVALDILPMTRDDIARRTLTWPESGFVMNLGSFDLLFAHTHKLALDDTHELQIATVPVIVILKMHSWLDRPHERSRDLQDIGYIMSEYLDDDADRRWNDARLEGIEFDEQGALALGLDIAQIAGRHHRDVIDRFLANVGEAGTHAFTLLASTGRHGGRGHETALEERLIALRRGLDSLRDR